MGTDAMGAEPEGVPEAGFEILTPVQESSFPEVWYELNLSTHFWFKWRLTALLKQLSDLRMDLESPRKILDIGCGTGLLRDQLEARSGWVIDGVDLNVDALRRAGKGRGRLFYYDIFEKRAPFVEAYDCVLLFDVLEHIEHTRPFLEGVLSTLKPGGLLLLNVPALRLLFSAYDRAAGHVRRYDRAALTGEFEDFEMEVRDIRYWGFSLVPLLLLRKAVLMSGKSDTEIIERGFAVPGRFVNSVLRMVQRVETGLFSHPWWGTSLLLAVTKSG